MSEPKEYSFDAAALAGATLAASLVLFTNPGPFDWFACIVGVTLLFIIIAYEYPRQRQGLFQTLALGAVAALAALLVLDYMAEMILKAAHVELSKTCKTIMLPSGVVDRLECEEDSRVSATLQVLMWITLGIAFSVIDRIYQKRRGTRMNNSAGTAA